MKANTRNVIIKLTIPTSDGEFVASYSEAGLAALDFPSSKPTAKAVANDEILPGIGRWHRATTLALRRALAGRAPRVLPPLDLSAGTAFQQQVWNALLRIPCGETRSYGEIACELGAASAARSVGSACGANPVPVFVPCHRVLAAKGHLGGFSGGLKWKRLLLGREGLRDWWAET